MTPDELQKEVESMGEIITYKFEEWAETRSDKTFFYYGEQDRRISYQEFNALANQVAHNLASRGIEKGNRVSLFLLNPLVSTLAMFGLWKIGAVFCPINFNYTGRLLAYQLNDTQPKLLITERGREEIINNVKDDISVIPIIRYEPKEGDHDFSPEAAAMELEAVFPVSSFDDLLTGDASNPGTELNYWDTASIIYTSGTTGPAKGVVQPYRWLVNYCSLSVRLIHPEDVVYNDLPLYHVGGAFANVVRAAWGGASVAVWDRFSPTEFWSRIEKSGANWAILLDVMMPWLLLAEETPQDRHNTLSKVHMQPLPEYHHKFAQRFGIDIVTCGFGQTESGMGFRALIDQFGPEDGTPKELQKGNPKDVSLKMARDMDLPIVPGDQPLAKGYMGTPSIFLEAAVLDERDNQLGPGKHGQLAFRSKLPYLLLDEYFNKPEATLEVFKNQWFHTGDGVYKDEKGHYYFVDRMGGFIRSRGENISSYQIEDIVNSHPKVGVSAAFPIPAEEGEEDDVVVYITPAPGQSLEEAELREWLKTEMPKFMWPKHIRFIDALPQTPTYKVEKYKLKKMILEELAEK